MKELSPQYLSEFCSELALLVQAGVPLSEGILVMRDDNNDSLSRDLLDSLYESLENDSLLSNALESSGLFSDYFISMIRLGESSGRLEETLSSLSTYYERRALLSENLKRAVAYPLMILVLLSAVVVVIVTEVLPIFNEVFNQVGVQMSGLALSLMKFGESLSSASTIILLVIILLICVGFVIYKIPVTRKAFSEFLKKRCGGRGVLKQITISHFAMAMSMAISSGLNAEQAISLAGDVCGESYNMNKKVSDCKKYLENGDGLEKSLFKSEIFSKRDCRLLALGVKTGKTDIVMSTIARQREEKVLGELDDKLRKIEPTLVIIMSLVVGLILFSVMLPLMGIMSSIS